MALMQLKEALGPVFFAEKATLHYCFDNTPPFLEDDFARTITDALGWYASVESGFVIFDEFLLNIFHANIVLFGFVEGGFDLQNADEITVADWGYGPGIRLGLLEPIFISLELIYPWKKSRSGDLQFLIRGEI